ncbi:hypothetical protein E4U43_006729 [Claviceps pusilla]|uniref:Uncharacterized protein n=1 Tax=Claviceps pusilla TaxID=123648 RepID=A0A9P7NDJ6_9HYPO|nr:hypothetical protein E4U43_006729 [Claviceps pusilla]
MHRGSPSPAQELPMGPYSARLPTLTGILSHLIETGKQHSRTLVSAAQGTSDNKDSLLSREILESESKDRGESST